MIDPAAYCSIWTKRQTKNGKRMGFHIMDSAS
jgi:hypothetical protein